MLVVKSIKPFVIPEKQVSSKAGIGDPGLALSGKLNSEFCLLTSLAAILFRRSPELAEGRRRLTPFGTFDFGSLILTKLMRV